MEKIIIKTLIKIIDCLSDNNHTNIEFQITEDHSIIIISKNDDLTFYNEIFYELDNIEIVSNVFQNKKQIKHSTGDINNILLFLNSK